MISERQEKILKSLIEQYINIAEPVGSEHLKKEGGFDLSPATIRNELQELTELGFITQPHTSAGRVPTNKGYEYFIEVIFSDRQEDHIPHFILREIETAKEKIEKELALARELTQTLEELSQSLRLNHIEEHAMLNILKIITPSRTTYDRNMNVINDLIRELGQF